MNLMWLRLILVCTIAACHVSCGWLPLKSPVLRQVVEADSEAERCNRISQAMEDLWEAIPDVNIEILYGRIGNGTKIKVALEGQFRQMADESGFTTPSNTIATQQGRREVACRLAGVQNEEDYLGLFSEDAAGPARRQYQWLRRGFQEDNLMVALRDAREMINMIKYFTRISGFPNFPLDIYDEDMVRYIIQRIKGHEVALEFFNVQERAFSEENINKYVKIMKSDTPDLLVDFIGPPPIYSQEQVLKMVTGLMQICGTLPKAIDLFEVLYEGGFFGI